MQATARLLTIGIGVGLAVGLGAGCLTDDPDPTLGEVTAAVETVVEPPEMSVICDGCFGTGHIVGDPVTITTSFYGACTSPPFHTEYPCSAQPYLLTIECLSGACAQEPAGGDAWYRWTHVTPLGTGPITIRVRMNDHVVTFAPFSSTVPDDVRATCTTGSGYDQPCVAGANEPRVRLSFAVYGGGERLYPTGRFDIASDHPGLVGGNAGQDWYLSAPGLHRVRASYGPVSREVEVTVATPPPPPPPPVGHDVGRQPMPALTALAPR